MIKNLLRAGLERVPASVLERILAYPILRESFPAVAKTPCYPGKELLWKDLFEKYLQDGPICVLEFGVWRGSSMRNFLTLNTHKDSLFYGFDSFEGLPESWRPGYGQGFFSTAAVLPEFDDRRVQLVKGWFNQTLEPFLAAQQGLVKSIATGQRKLFVHFDADLFSSTLYLLASLSIVVREYYCVFDEFTGDESRALNAASRAFDLTSEFYGHTRTRGTRYALQASGKITRKSLPEFGT